MDTLGEHSFLFDDISEFELPFVGLVFYVKY
jgi:hypothetical protein